MSTQLDRLLAEIRACRACVDAPRGRPLPHEQLVGSTAPGYVTAWTSGAPEPGTSSLNFAAGALRSNIATLPLGPDGAVDARALLFGGSGVHLILDVSGYYLVED